MGPDADRLRALVDAYRAGTIGDDEARELDEALRDPQAAASIRAELDWAGEISAAFTAEDKAFAAGVLDRIAPRPALRWPTRIALAAAAVLAIGLAWWRFTSVQAGSAEPSLPMVVSTGARLHLGDRVTAPADSGLDLRWSDDTEIVLDPSSAITLLAGPGKRFSLDHGRLTAEVAKQASDAPLVIATPLATATVLGTGFTLKTDGQETLLEVAHGRVRLADSHDAVEVAAGWRGRAQSGLPVALEPTLAAATVTIAVGDDLQQAIDAHPAGTIFRIAAGLHRLAQARPKDGDVFIGEPGAVLSGARELVGFQGDDHGWWIGGQTQHGTENGQAERGWEGSTLAEQLFVDGQPLRRVRARDQLAAGTWMLDYDSGLLRLADDPAGHRVETSVSAFAFAGPAKDVTVADLLIEQYANPAQMGAIGSQAPAAGWSVLDCELTLNHGAGLACGDRWRVARCRIHGNGQLGINAGGAGAAIVDNDIVGNNTAHFVAGWEAGGLVCDSTDALAIVHNRVERNAGYGIMAERGDRRLRIEGNRVADNAGFGIGVYLGSGARILGNEVRRNGRAFDHWLWGAQIQVRNAAEVEIARNTVEVAADGGNGIALIQQEEPEHPTARCSVHDNDVVFRGARGQCGAVADWNVAALWEDGNRFDGNRYHAAGLGAVHWAWRDADLTWEQLRALGLEAHGSFDAVLPPATSASP